MRKQVITLEKSFFSTPEKLAEDYKSNLRILKDSILYIQGLHSWRDLKDNETYVGDNLYRVTAEFELTWE